MYGLDPLTRQCTYETPCGWCTKWDKKCDKKIGVSTTSNESKKHIAFKRSEISLCNICEEDSKVFSLCAECGGAPDYKYFKPKE